MSNYKTVFFTLGILLVILGVAMLIPVIFQLFYKEFNSTFIISSIITVIFGILFFLSNLDHDRNIDLPQAFILTALSWLSIALFGSLPFIFSKLNGKFFMIIFSTAVYIILKYKAGIPIVALSIYPLLAILSLYVSTRRFQE